MKTRNDCEIACDCVKRANVVLHVGLCKQIFARKHTATHNQPRSAHLPIVTTMTHIHTYTHTHTHTHTHTYTYWSPVEPLGLRPSRAINAGGASRPTALWGNNFSFLCSATVGFCYPVKILTPCPTLAAALYPAFHQNGSNTDKSFYHRRTAPRDRPVCWTQANGHWLFYPIPPIFLFVCIRPRLSLTAYKQKIEYFTNFRGKLLREESRN